jgi:hypothetical protein
MQYRKTKYLRTRWVINDLGNFYLNDVMEWEWVKNIEKSKSVGNGFARRLQLAFDQYK